MHNAKILADSISGYGHRLTTFELVMPRIVLAEHNTHCMFARNSASSRAIPVKKMLRMVMENPYVPSEWGKNQKGMQALEEILGEEAVSCEKGWLKARDLMVDQAQYLMDIGVHKQLTNRLLEPFMWHTVINTATDYWNYFHLRNDVHAHPDIRKVAAAAQHLYETNTPRELTSDQWHLPITTDEEWTVHHERSEDLEELIKVSTGRCTRVSYLTHDGVRDLSADVGLHDKILGNGHMSPLEHEARPMDKREYTELFCQPILEWRGSPTKGMWEYGSRNINGVDHADTHYCGKFNGWVQYRKMIRGEEDYGRVLKEMQTSE